MDLVADEGIESQIVERLRQDGFTVYYVAEESPRAEDSAILQEANSRQALLLTNDKDFGDLVFRQSLVHAGVILLRLAGLSSNAKAETVSTALRERTQEMIDSFSVITPGLIRIRRRDSLS